MKVKIITAMSDVKLEKQVNLFLAEPGIKVQDLKFAASENGMSVMIVYEDVNA